MSCGVELQPVKTQLLCHLVKPLVYRLVERFGSGEPFIKRKDPLLLPVPVLAEQLPYPLRHVNPHFRTVAAPVPRLRPAIYYSPAFHPVGSPQVGGVHPHQTERQPEAVQRKVMAAL